MTATATPVPPLISLVVPFLNEAAVLPQLFATLARVLPGLAGHRWELVLVDDGSTDDSAACVRREAGRFPGAVRLVRLSRNFGHQPALLAGLRTARGAAVIALDADLQDPPELFAEFLRHFATGHDVVYAVRQNRRESGWKRAAYWLFYRLFRRFAEVQIPLDAGDFGLMSRRVVALVSATAEHDLLLRGLRSWSGFRQLGVPYDRPERPAGETKYTLRRLGRLAGSAFFGYSTLPLRLATWLGLGAAAVGALYGAYVLCAKLTGASTPQGWASLALLLLFLGGAQLVCVGILGEYIGRIYQQVQARPQYVVAEELVLAAD
jgi:polyisoprenyl-phosphate glycosyltransferase